MWNSSHVQSWNHLNIWDKYTQIIHVYLKFLQNSLPVDLHYLVVNSPPRQWMSVLWFCSNKNIAICNCVRHCEKIERLIRQTLLKITSCLTLVIGSSWNRAAVATEEGNLVVGRFIDSRLLQMLPHSCHSSIFPLLVVFPLSPPLDWKWLPLQARPI